MHIRNASSEDIPAIVDLGRMIFTQHQEFDKEYYNLENNFDYLFGLWLNEQIINPSKVLIVAENENCGEVIGFISGFIKILYPWFKNKTVGHIGYLIINPKYRRQGIGKKLEDAAINWYKDRNIPYIELYVEEKNEIGQKAWSSYGFEPFKKLVRKKIR